MNDIINRLTAVYGELEQLKGEGWQYLTRQINSAQYHLNNAITALLDVEELIEQ